MPNILHYNYLKLFKFFRDRILLLISLDILLFSLGIYLAFFNSPADYQQGDYVRIMYVHVPSAWLSLLIYTIMTFSSFIFLVFNISFANILSKEIAPLGAAFTLITLITGSLWGKPTWGTYWVFDARLTFMLILFFIYIAYIALCDAYRNYSGSKAPAILVVFGFINVPIIKFSVDMWNTLHQSASVFRLDGPQIDILMLRPLIIMFLASCTLSLIILTYKIDSHLIEKKIQRKRFLK